MLARLKSLEELREEKMLTFLFKVESLKNWILVYSLDQLKIDKLIY